MLLLKGTSKAKEHKAEEAAENERIKKQREEQKVKLKKKLN